MLSKSQIEFNKKKFIETIEKYQIFSEQLMEFLGDEIYISPATSTKDMYGCFPGGLVNHILKSTRYAIKTNESFPENLRVNNSSLVRVMFLSQIGRTYMYQFNENEWERDKLGKIYTFKNKDVIMKTGMKSVFYAFNNNTTLSEEEFHTILSLDDDKSNKLNTSMLTLISKIGIELAMIEEKENGKRNTT
jgi:hypothetical protein